MTNEAATTTTTADVIVYPNEYARRGVIDMLATFRRVEELRAEGEDDAADELEAEEARYPAGRSLRIVVTEQFGSYDYMEIELYDDGGCERMTYHAARHNDDGRLEWGEWRLDSHEADEWAAAMGYADADDYGAAIIEELRG